MSPIVDIGGGIGSLEMVLLKEETNSALSFIIFDTPVTIGSAKKVCSRPPVNMYQSENCILPGLEKSTHIGVIPRIFHSW